MKSTEVEVVNSKEGPFLLKGSDSFEVEIQSDYEQLTADYGPRFENLGRVTQVRLNRMTFLTKEGLIDETGIKTPHGPFGYLEANPGESFVKLGVGELCRGEEQLYVFHRPYKVIRRHPIEINSTDNSVTFRETASGHSKWGYTYQKTYSIDPELPVLTIRYELTNTGKERLHSEQYNHNWFQFGLDGQSREYTISMDFEPIRMFDGPIDIEPFKLYLESALIRIPLPFRRPSFINFLTTSFPDENRIVVGRAMESAQIEIRGDFPVAHFAVYGQQEIVCPEVFVHIDLPPGKTMSWCRAYVFKS